MTQKNTIPIFFSIDEAYAPYLSTALMSLFEHTSKEKQYDIIIVYHKLTRTSQDKLKRIANDYPQVNMIFIEMQKNLIGIFDRKETRLKADIFTPTIYYRIFLPEMFPQYDKGVYLDSDIIVLEDIAELFNTNLNNNLLAACLDMSTIDNPVFRQYFIDAVGIKTDQYFNAGVLLMNFKQFRRKKIWDYFLHLLNTYNFDTVAMDQDYLNIVCNGKVKYLDISWNTMPTSKHYSEAHPKLIHYNLFFKPWHYDDTRYSEFYWEYANNSIFLDSILKEKKQFTEMILNGNEMSDDVRMKLLISRCKEIIKEKNTFKKVFSKTGANNHDYRWR